MKYGKKTIDGIEVVSKADGKFPVVALVGSTRYEYLYKKKALEFQLAGYIVLMTPCFRLKEDSMDCKGLESLLMQQGYQRIDMADEVYCINPYDYIGSNTLDELKYAKETGKTIKFFTPTHFIEFLEEENNE